MNPDPTGSGSTPLDFRTDPGLRAPICEGLIKWADKSTTSYIMFDFKSYIKSLYSKYLVIERYKLQIQGILLQYLKLN